MEHSRKLSFRGLMPDPSCSGGGGRADRKVKFKDEQVGVNRYRCVSYTVIIGQRLFPVPETFGDFFFNVVKS